MSFGFAIGDLLAVINLADQLRRDWLDAPEEYEAICSSTRDLSNALRDVNDLADRTDLTESQASNLRHAVSGCTDVLELLDKIVVKYSTIRPAASTASTRRDVVQRTWRRLRTRPADIRNARERSTAALVSLNTASGAITRTWTQDVRQDTRLLVKDQAHRRKLEIANWLAPGTFAEHHSSYLAQRCPETSDWFAQDLNFLRWRNNNATTLFCPGIPGAGKTVLAAAVVHHLQELYQGDCNVAVVYHYYDTKRPDEKGLRYLLASFARQLLQQKRAISTTLTNLYDKHEDRGTRPTVKELGSLFEDLISDYQQAYIIIDALDEADVHQRFQTDLLDEIFKVQAVHKNVNLMTTSRQRPDIAAFFGSCEQMCIRAHDDDLRKYLDSRMPELMSGAGRIVQLQDEIKEQIVQIADGMFLLARLHFDSLRVETTPRAVRRALERLPKGSEAVSIAYEAARERIGQQSKGRRDIAMQTLMWISCGLRTLTLQQIQHALAIEPDMDDIDADYDLVGEMDLLSACAGLVLVDDESNVVHLVHLTLNEYLERVREAWFPDAYTLLATKCVDYLSLGIFGRDDEVEWLNGGTPVSKILRDHDFCGYSFWYHATKFWGFYAQKSGRQELSGRLCLKLFAKPTQWRYFCRFLALPFLEMRQCAWWHEDVNPLHVAAYFGFQDFAKQLLASDHDLQSKDSHGMTALMWAAKYGQQGMIEFILDRSGADVLLESDSRGVTPLIFAAENGHTKVVAFLLEQKNIDPNVLSKYDGTALNCAASEGHLDVIQLLLSHPKTRPRTRKEGRRSPLQSAARHGHIEVINLLLEQVHWEVDDWGPNDSSPLHLAASRGHKEIVELLIRRPETDINAPGWKGATPLAEAASSQQSDVMKILLAQTHLLPNKQDNYGTTPLMRAIRGIAAPKLGDVLAILNHRGVDPNLTDNHGHGSLVYAIRLSSVEDVSKVVFRALLAIPDIIVNSKDEYGYTPLHHAVIRNRADAVHLLLQRDDVDLEAESQDGYTAVTLALEKARADKILETKYGTRSFILTCGASRDSEKPHVVVITSSREPEFSLEFSARDVLSSTIKVQDVKMALSSRWQIDIRRIQLRYKDVDLNLGWSALSDFYWRVGDAINVEIAPVARSFNFTTEEYAELDAKSSLFNETWHLLRAASHKIHVSKIDDDNSITGAGDAITSTCSIRLKTELDFDFGSSDGEDKGIRQFLGMNRLKRKRNPVKPTLEAQSGYFELPAR